VIQVSNPTKPQRVGGCNTIAYAQGVAVSGNYVYVAEGGAGLEVIDVSDPANPRRVGGYDDTRGYARDVTVSGNYAYVAYDYAGLEVIDVSNPANPQRVVGYDTRGYAEAVSVSGSYAYVVGENRWTGSNYVGFFEVVDVSNPANPQRAGSYTGMAAHGVAVSGNYAYLPHGASLEVIDVSDPTQPRRVGGNSAFYTSDVIVAGNNVFVAAGGQGLTILDLFRAPLWLEPVSPQQPGAFRFLLHGEAGLSARVQRSSNLEDWEDWQAVTLGAAPTQLTDPDASVIPHRFYRAVYP
jgi:hypothetical protein